MSVRSPQVQTVSEAKLLRGPPAIWAAFAAQGRWKNWVMAGQMFALLFLMAVCLSIAKTEPDVIVVAEDGRGRYVEQSAATGPLLDFLRAQRGKASELSLLAFTQGFVRLTVGVNSTTIDEAWSEALSMMAPPLREKSAREAESQKLLETYRLAQVRTQLAFKDVVMVERTSDKAHVRAVVERRRERLFGDAKSADDVVEVDLVVADVPRSRERPDGLEILDWRVGAPSSSPSNAATSEVLAP